MRTCFRAISGALLFLRSAGFGVRLALREDRAGVVLGFYDARRFSIRVPNDLPNDYAKVFEICASTLLALGVSCFFAPSRRST